MYSARAYKIPECTRTAAGTPLVQVMIKPFFPSYVNCFHVIKSFLFYLFIYSLKFNMVEPDPVII